jgi:hypothetical protein
MGHLDMPNFNNSPPISKKGKEEEEGSMYHSVVDIPVFQYESRTG